MNYFTDHDNHIIIKRHKMIMAFTLSKIVFLLLVCGFLYFVGGFIGKDSVYMLALRFADFFIIFCILHYAFFTLMSILIKYYNNVIIISKDSIVLIKCSLILKDDIEVIDCYRIEKVDAFVRGFVPNMLGYGSIVIEQQKNDVKVLQYIPKPHKLLGVIKKQREHLLQTITTNNR